MMGLTELDTAVRNNIPILVIVIDDGAYGAELHLLRRAGLPIELAMFDNPDIARVASALGWDTRFASTAADLTHALRSITSFKRPTLVHVRVNRSVVHNELFAALGGRSVPSSSMGEDTRTRTGIN